MAIKGQRQFVFTINNYTSDTILSLQNYNTQQTKNNYLVWGQEVGPSGTPHIQGYVEHETQVTFSAFNKRLGLKKGGPFADCSIRRGHAHDAAGYCLKGPTKEEERPASGWRKYFEEPHADWIGAQYGDCLGQGARQDIQAVVNTIMEGGTTCDDVLLENPEFYHQYGRTISKAEDLAMRLRFRYKQMTKGYWIWGPTAVGKSSIAFREYSPHTHYLWKQSRQNSWQDAYTQQPVIIINEFRGSIPYNELLDLVDQWPYALERRNREPLPVFNLYAVVITSSLPPEEVYHHRHAEDSLKQFHRRFKVLNIKSTDQIIKSVLESKPPWLAFQQDVPDENLSEKDDSTEQINEPL